MTRSRPSTSWRSNAEAVGLLLLGTALLSACHRPPPKIVPPPPSTARVLALQQSIAALVSDPALTRVTWGIVVKSALNDETLYTFNADKLLLPASTLKIVTLAATADRLGWDFQYRTRVLSAGLIEDGVLHGDLVIAGSGDPSIDDWDGAASEIFTGWAQDLQRAGIRRITGRIVGDDRVFESQGLGSGWAWDDLGASYAAPAGGLQFNENSARLTVAPGAGVGEPVRTTVEPESAVLTLRTVAKTAAPGAESTIQVRVLPMTSVLEVRGSLAIDAAPTIRNAAVPNPTIYFANAVRQALVRNGIEVDGPAVDLDDLADPPDQNGARALTDTVSPPLRSIAGTMMKLSQNLLAETMLKTLGGVAAGSGSTEGGFAIVRSELAGWGISERDVLMADGSGLSRYNLVTSNAMAGVLLHVYRDDRLRDRFIDTLPIAGVDGTLSDRMRGTAAGGNARAKTGSMTGVRAIAGFVHTADQEPIVFVVLANNYGAEPKAIDRVSDAIIIALGAFSRR